MIKYIDEDAEGLVAVRITDTISKNEYNALLPEMERKIDQCGRINLYLEIKDGVRWNAKSFWSDINFNLKHAQDIRKVAFVGDDELEDKIIELLKPVENAEIRWYNYSEKKDAMDWLGVKKLSLQERQAIG